MYSKRLALYLNQIAQYQAQTVPDNYGNMQYTSPQTIKVRKEGKARLVRDTNGETIVSSTTVFSITQINPMDMIDGTIVINSMSMVDKSGNIIGWESYL